METSIDKTVRQDNIYPNNANKVALSVLNSPASLLSESFGAIAKLPVLISGDVKNNRQEYMRQSSHVSADEDQRESRLKETYSRFIKRVSLPFLAFHWLVAEPLHYLVELPFAWLSRKTDEYKSEISIAFWVALGLGLAAATGGAVMAVYFPAALATLAGVSVFGLSLASIAGASAVAQVALFACLVVAAADVVGLALAAVIDAGIAVVKMFHPNHGVVERFDESDSEINFSGGNQGAPLHASIGEESTSTAEKGKEPQHFNNLFSPSSTEPVTGTEKNEGLKGCTSKIS